MAEPTMKEKVVAALDALYKAQADFLQATERQSKAQRECATALNELNKAQKALDSIVAEHKKGAHRETDWGRPQSVSPVIQRE